LITIFGVYPPCDFGKDDVATTIAAVDDLRLYALLDEDLPDDAGELFYALATAIFSAQLSEFALKAEVGTDFQVLNHNDIEGQFFIYGLPKSVPEWERVFECVARCGDAQGDSRKLTRSPVFSACTGGLVKSTN